jgi:hypothetical protein
VRHACKSLSPGPIKGRAIPQLHGTRRQITITYTLSTFATILALASINTSRTWRPGLLSHHACSPPIYEHHGCDNPPRKIPYYRLRPIHFGH